MANLDEDILINFGGLEINSLKPIVQSDDDNSLITSTATSSYYTVDGFTSLITKYSNDFNIITLNSQSLNAKFNRI